jgi:hypothetical protein
VTWARTSARVFGSTGCPSCTTVTSETRRCVGGSSWPTKALGTWGVGARALALDHAWAHYSE